MSKKHSKKRHSDLTLHDREVGRNRIFIIIGMIIVGLAVAIYNIQ